MPVAFTVRLIPLGPRSPVQPYIGAGVGVINWRYSESGEFIDFGAGNVIFQDTFVNERQQRRPGRPGWHPLRRRQRQRRLRDQVSEGHRRSRRELRRAEDRSRWVDVQLHGRDPVLRISRLSVERDPSSLTHLRHPAREVVIAADVLSEHVAAF